MIHHLEPRKNPEISRLRSITVRFQISKYLYGFLVGFRGRRTRFQGSWRRGVRHLLKSCTRFRNQLDFQLISDFKLDFSDFQAPEINGDLAKMLD